VLAATWLPQGARVRKLAWFAAAGGFALLFAVVGRGTLLGLAAGAVIVAAVFGRPAFALLKNLALAALLGLLLFLLMFWLLPLLTGADAEFPDGYYGARMGSVEARLYLWQIALSDIVQSPWLGIGPMHYAHSPNGEAAHPHNIYLQIAAEWGLPMLILLVTLGALALRSMARRIRSCDDAKQRTCGIGLWFACLVIAIDGLVSGNFVMPVSQVWIAFTVGWALAWYGAQTQPQSGIDQRHAGKHGMGGARRFVAVGLLASQVGLIWNAWPEITNLNEHVSQTMQRVSSPTMNPRFWSHGWF
jgi:O-antigen ligase